MNLEGIFSFGWMLAGYMGFICYQMRVWPWELWVFESHKERNS